MTTPSRATLALIALAVGLHPEPAGAKRPRGVEGAIVLGGERVAVSWTDGDTFRLRSGSFRGRSARLAGVNTLETYGPVHRLGTLRGEALLGIAQGSAALAAARTWRCETDGKLDAYRRLLVTCPDAAEALVAAGHALVFAVDGAPEPRLLAAQRRAQAARAGMWAGGAPPLVPTSLHSVGERGLGPRGAYDRIADTRTGVAEARPHARSYDVCEAVCLGEGAERACLTYVPFELRYRRRPACLR